VSLSLGAVTRDAAMASRMSLSSQSSRSGSEACDDNEDDDPADEACDDDEDDDPVDEDDDVDADHEAANSCGSETIDLEDAGAVAEAIPK
jgi:hypothetical protein